MIKIMIFVAATDQKRFDFVIVGSGAGGGPLAANLASAGFKVLLLEAGDDHSCPYYDVPIMQARASEDEHMRWDFFVRHYSANDQQQLDSKFVEAHNGVLYYYKNLVTRAERVGIDSFWVMDHFHQIPLVGEQDEPMLEQPYRF